MLIEFESGKCRCGCKVLVRHACRCGVSFFAARYTRLPVAGLDITVLRTHHIPEHARTNDCLFFSMVLEIVECWGYAGPDGEDHVRLVQFEGPVLKALPSPVAPMHRRVAEPMIAWTHKVALWEDELPWQWLFATGYQKKAPDFEFTQ